MLLPPELTLEHVDALSVHMGWAGGVPFMVMYRVGYLMMVYQLLQVVYQEPRSWNFCQSTHSLSV